MLNDLLDRYLSLQLLYGIVGVWLLGWGYALWAAITYLSLHVGIVLAVVFVVVTTPAAHAFVATVQTDAD